MIEAPTPNNEIERQRAVESYNLLDSFPEDSYDNITEIICYIAKAPISLITLLDNDRNYIKSNCGFPLNESPRNISFCGHAIQSEDEIMIVEDARKEKRFHDNPLVKNHNAIFYAGVPLVNPKGYKLGTLCVYDHEPRQLDEAQKKALIAMSKQVVRLFEQHKQNKTLKDIKNKLEKRNLELDKFASIVSHDLKSPLANIISLTELLEQENEGKLNADSKTYLNYLKSSSSSLKDYIDGILLYYKNDLLHSFKKESLTFNTLILEAKKIAIPKNDIKLEYSENIENININKPVALQILVNLITNAIKYNDKNTTEIMIGFETSSSHYLFSIKDNGNGIPVDKLNSIFDLFTTLGQKDKDGNLGTGIGLATVKKLVENQGGDISVTSTEGVGSTFSFSIKK
ncbi:GAF domain-containing sensor histidine kinase [Lacinutrix sp. Bg11-31]|uniref:GAF domain-containing sensor histidine kinase n=1 Tax=Lacinutrix sp. Bg11-31 TaxID=2057808 RepID=UPI000C30B84D|nr:GAF domain-containing sensor histidine kinase [Lacinutrix sp. Bg11-31]AUC83673.1 ATPase [Lacinutrix sp. Bg11-31]